MSAGISLEELLAWNEESSNFWKAHLDANPHLLDLPCGIGGTANVREFVGHVWGVELRWNQGLAGLPTLTREEMRYDSLDGMFDLHKQAMEIFRGMLAAPEESWEQTYVLTVDWLPLEMRTPSRRKAAAHLLFHSQRHWAQLGTLVRAAGFPSDFKGDLLFSPALR
jgi:hypothetical protein